MTFSSSWSAGMDDLGETPFPMKKLSNWGGGTHKRGWATALTDRLYTELLRRFEIAGLPEDRIIKEERQRQRC